MLQDEAVLHQLQDTPYRLCSCDDSSAWTKVLNVKWDPCSGDRIFICSQDGKLRRYQFSTSEFSTYQVVFRAFAAPTQSSTGEARVIKHHWDKFEPIPGREGEFVFLLGVSRSIFYTALPGVSAAPIAFSTRADDGDYSHGTPILGLWNHPTRITALALSDDGCVLASGNEDGDVHLVQLQRPLRSSRSHWLQDAPSLEDASLRLKAHSGPIFAFAWIPDALDDAAYRLATGSQGHVVRIWRVNAAGPTLECALISELHTATCLVLSLCTAPYLEVGIASSAHDVVGAAGSEGADVEASTSRLDHVLCAGTDQGSLYIWRLSDNQPIFLIHHTEHPIIHAALCASTAYGHRNMPPQVEMALATVDTVGSLRLYNSTPSGALVPVGVEDGDAPEVSAAVQSRSHTVDTFVFAGQMDFSAAVVACGFSSNASAFTNTPIPRQDSFLVAATSVGQLRRWHVSQLPRVRGSSAFSQTPQPEQPRHMPHGQAQHRPLQDQQLPPRESRASPARQPVVEKRVHFDQPDARAATRPKSAESQSESAAFDDAMAEHARQTRRYSDDSFERPQPTRQPEPSQTQHVETEQQARTQDRGQASAESPLSAARRTQPVEPRQDEYDDQGLRDVAARLEEPDAEHDDWAEMSSEQPYSPPPRPQQPPARPRRKSRPVPQPLARTAPQVPQQYEPANYPTSTFADAIPNTVRHLSAAVEEQTRRANAVTTEEVSLSSEDLRFATRGLSVPPDEQRYYDLISVNSDSTSVVMRGRAKPKKQVDPAWLKRRSELAPTREELQQLQVPKPQPEIVITSSTASALQRLHDTINHLEDHISRPKVYVDIGAIGRPAKPAESLGAWVRDVDADYRHSTRALLNQTF